MNNILRDHNPNAKIEGRLLGTLKYVNESDIKDKVILNIGCGFGWFELYAIQNGVKKIFGLEISEKDLKVAKDNINNLRASFTVGSAIDLPFTNSTFDTVVLWEVIEHIPKDTECIMFAEINRVLKNKGIVYISTPHRTFFTNLLDPAWWLIGHRHYSNTRLKELSKKYFKIINTTIKGKWWTIIGLLNMYFSKWVLRRSPLFDAFFSEKITNEYVSNDGFANIFIMLKKKNEK